MTTEKHAYAKRLKLPYFKPYTYEGKSCHGVLIKTVLLHARTHRALLSWLGTHAPYTARKNVRKRRPNHGDDVGSSDERRGRGQIFTLKKASPASRLRSFSALALLFLFFFHSFLFFSVLFVAGGRGSNAVVVVVVYTRFPP